MCLEFDFCFDSNATSHLLVRTQIIIYSIGCRTSLRINPRNSHITTEHLSSFSRSTYTKCHVGTRVDASAQRNSNGTVNYRPFDLIVVIYQNFAVFLHLNLKKKKKKKQF